MSLKRIIISGVGGQGVRIIAHTLATFLFNLGYEVALLYDYDSSVRGEMSAAYLTYGDEPVTSPVIEKADIMLKLANKAHGLVAERTIGEEGMAVEEEIPFAKLGMRYFGREIFGNMIALGRMMRLIGLEVDYEALKQILPLSYREENISAIHYGYNLLEHDLQRGTESTESRWINYIAPTPGEGDLEAEVS